MWQTLVAGSFCSLIVIACKTQGQSILGNFDARKAKDLMANQSLQDCPLTADNRADWSKCIGHLVKVRGTTATEVVQHVSRNFDPMGRSTGYQNYMDALDYQFVLLSDQSIPCRNELEVEGVLHYFALGGTADTKAEYANYEIRVDVVSCLEPTDRK